MSQPLAYYNEFDPKAAEWLRELIKAGLIAHGVVDQRSITDVKADELAQYTQCHFFAGIGGWSLAFRLAGWPDDRPVGSGSCPCQPFSGAGAGLGTADPRHLWPVLFRLIVECRARGQRWTDAFFGEQVASKAALGWLDGVFADLEGAGYACGAADLCAAGLGAPHIRQRLNWVAYAQRLGREATDEQSRDGGEADRLGEAGPAGGRRARGGMADADGRNASAEREQCGGEQRLEPEDGQPRGMANANAPERRADDPARDDVDGADAGRPEGDVQLGTDGSARRVGDPGRPRLEGRGLPERSLVGPGGQVEPRLFPLAGFWDKFALIACTDGKARRVEPGSFPLANGVPGRVGLLRGYGNAIVPQEAAEFILAAEEAVK